MQERPRWGWNRPARVFLLLLVATGSGFLAILTTSTPPPPDPAPRLVEDANAAPVAVLEALPGIGPVLAGRIDAARSQRPFQSLADLDRRVKGVGKVRADALKPFLSFPSGPEPSSRTGPSPR